MAATAGTAGLAGTAGMVQALMTKENSSLGSLMPMVKGYLVKVALLAL